MQSNNRNNAAFEDWHNYRIESRREIVSLLRTIGEKNQLIRVLINGESDVAVTSILDVDPDADLVVLDCSINRDQNRRMVTAHRLQCETTLDKIRILFSTDDVEECEHEGRPALCINIPRTLIRLQRRELYRMETPLTNPVRCTIPLPADLGGGTVTLPLADISGGGIALLDDKMVLDNTAGFLYRNCRIDLPDIGAALTSLEVRSSHDLTLPNGKTKRRIGLQFINLPKPTTALVQKYIMKLERERNARISGRA